LVSRDLTRRLDPVDHRQSQAEDVLTAEFLGVTEIEGQRISREQLSRMCHRYHWAAQQCEGLDVLEVGCGAGQGLNILRRRSRSVVAGDYSPEVLEAAVTNFRDIPLSVFGAESIPFPDGSFDRVLLFEALYYVHAKAFFAEARRVLRPGGVLLLATANKDLYDFTPSPFTTRYLGTTELVCELKELGFEVELFGYIDTATVGLRQRILRPVKALASRLGLIPKTMRGKELLKKLFFGSMTEMPADLTDVDFDFTAPTPLPGSVPDTRHKVLYCRAVCGQEG
jgi:SAM-dependent methyltransferase